MDETKLYIKEGPSTGYLDMEYIMEQKYPFTFVVGGRGIGKTYTSMKMLRELSIKFILMRRTQTQADMICEPEFSPWKRLNADLGWSITAKKLTKYNAGFYESDEDGKPLGLPVGYTCALSTLSNIRGFDASDVDVLLWDEFIAEKHERKMKNEALAFFNAVETINRNRELQGHPPIQCISLANSNNLANPIFLTLGIVKILVKLKKQGRMTYANKERGLLIVMLDDSPISKLKEDTALYRLTAGSEYAKMALGNEFTDDVVGRVKSMPIKEYKPICKYGDLCIYEHKSREELYCTMHKTGKLDEYNALGKADKLRFVRNYRWVWDYYMTEDIVFEEYLCEILLQDAFN